MEKALAAGPSFRLLDGRLQLEQLRAQGELVWNDTNSLVSGPFVRTIPGCTLVTDSFSYPGENVGLAFCRLTLTDREADRGTCDDLLSGRGSLRNNDAGRG